MSKKYFDTYIYKIMKNESNFIYKSNLELLRKFYSFIYEYFEDSKFQIRYLNSFKKIEDITPSNIEEFFSKMVTENELILNTLPSKFEKTTGLYFILDDLNTLLYVGRSDNLYLRAFQSYLNKLPYGANFLIIIDYEDSSILCELAEACSIDFWLPFYNNKKEPFNISHKFYAKIIFEIQEKFAKCKPYRFTLKKFTQEQVLEETIEVFDEIEKTI